MTLDIKDFYYSIPMDTCEYTKILLALILEEITE